MFKESAVHLSHPAARFDAGKQISYLDSYLEYYTWDVKGVAQVTQLIILDSYKEAQQDHLQHHVITSANKVGRGYVVIPVKT